MINVEEKVPFATTAIRKGLPLLDKNLTWILEEIQKKAKVICEKSKYTDAKEIAFVVNTEIQKWEIGSQEYLEVQLESFVFLLKSYIPNIQENNIILNRINKIQQESDIVKQYTLLNSLIPQIIDIKVSDKTNPIFNEIKELKESVDILTISIDEMQNPQDFLNIIQENLEEIKNDIPVMRVNIDKVLYDLYSPLSTTQKLKIAIPLIPLLAYYELETDVPKLVADRINELKNLALRFKQR
jgi:hypothetical protein